MGGRRPGDHIASEEAALVARARNGDGSALETLVELCLDDALDLAVRILDDYDAAQDAVQDGLLSAIRAVHAFRGDSSFRTWVLRIVGNAARNVARRRGRRREVDLTLAEQAPSTAPDPADDLFSQREGERLRAALARLPEKQRLAVTLRTFQGLNYRDIASIARCSEGSARVNYHLGVKRLKQILQ